MRPVTRSLCVLLLGAPLPSQSVQDVKTPPKRDRVPVETEACRRALVKLSARHRDAKIITASYRQERTTALLKRPLISTGTLALRKDPACMIFRTAGKHPTTIRLTYESYEVLRASRKTLERTPLLDRSLPDALFQAMAPQLQRLEKSFVIVESWRLGEALGIRLRPRKKASEFVQDITLVIDEKRNELRRVAYRDPQGDQISLILSELHLDPKLPKTAFELVIPDGTRVLVHKPPKKKPTK